MHKGSKIKFRLNNFVYFFLLMTLFSALSCSRNGYDPEKITHRPRIFLDGGSPVPILDEYDITGIKLGSFSDIFSNDPDKRIFGVWVGVDRRSAMTLQKETSRNIGRNLTFVVNGMVVAFHPIESTITNGFIPFIFTQQREQEDVYTFFSLLEKSIQHIKLEFQNQQN